MVASRIHCIVVEIPLGSDAIENRMRVPARDLLPDADPYIAALIRKLQDEVRQERAAVKPAGRVNRLTMLGLDSLGNIDMIDDMTLDFDAAEQDWPLLRDM